MSEFKKGDRVRVSFDADVDGIEAPPHIRVTAQDGTFAWVRSEHLEKLPDPEPEWQPGDVVWDARGYLYVRVGGYESAGVTYPWLRGGKIGCGDLDSDLARPLIPLLVGGKPVVSP